MSISTSLLRWLEVKSSKFGLGRLMHGAFITLALMFLLALAQALWLLVAFPEVLLQRQHRVASLVLPFLLLVPWPATYKRHRDLTRVIGRKPLPELEERLRQTLDWHVDLMAFYFFAGLSLLLIESFLRRIVQA
jgi:hypothetical protein